MARPVPKHQPPATSAMPPDPGTSPALPRYPSRPSSKHDDRMDTGTDGQHDHNLRLVTGAAASEWSRDQVAHVAPKSSFFICHTMRSGSTLLCDALGSTGVAGHAEEYFPERSHRGEVYVTSGAALNDPAAWLCDWTSTPFEQCLDRVLRCGTTPNGVFASKVRWLNMPYLGEMIGALPERAGASLAEHLDSLFPNFRYVWITRRNKVRQAVSLVKARQSKQWKATSAESRRSNATDYNFRLIDLALRGIVQEECAWEEYFTDAGITPFAVIYEDFVRNYESTVRSLLYELKVDLPTGYLFPPPHVHKQADATSDEWVERYHHDARTSRNWHMMANLPALLVSRPLRETYVVPRLHTQADRLLEGARTRILPQKSACDGQLAGAEDAFVRAHVRGPEIAPAIATGVKPTPAAGQTAGEVAEPKLEGGHGEYARPPRQECGKRARPGNVAFNRHRQRLGLVLALVVLGIVVSAVTALATSTSNPRLPSTVNATQRLSNICRHYRGEYAIACTAVPFEVSPHRA